MSFPPPSYGGPYEFPPTTLSAQQQEKERKRRRLQYQQYQQQYMQDPSYQFDFSSAGAFPTNTQTAASAYYPQAAATPTPSSQASYFNALQQPYLPPQQQQRRQQARVYAQPSFAPQPSTPAAAPSMLSPTLPYQYGYGNGYGSFQIQMPPPQSQQPRTPSAAVASQHQQQCHQYDMNTPYASYVHAQQQQQPPPPQYFPMTSTSVTPNPAFQSPSLPIATPQTQQAQVLAKSGTPLQLYDSPSLPHRVQSQRQPRQQPQVVSERYQQQYQQAALRQQYRERSLPQTPAQPIQTSAGKSGNSSRSGNSSGKSSFPKVEVQIFNRTPRKEDQNLHRPRSASPGKRPAPSAKRKSASLVSEEVVEQPPDPSMDYQALLLSLADEYLDAAHSQGATISATRKEEEIEEYYRLIATGLACFEAMLKTPRLSPSTEAVVRLRYALVLYEETDNDFETESTLTKGIDLCERNRFTDLKYTMQHILARVLFKSNPKAALKAVDSMVSEAEAYHNNAWEYSFRYLRATFAFSTSSHQDHVTALHSLQRIASSAKERGDKAVFVVTKTIEALAHLQYSSSTDATDQAQRCIAEARSYQLDPALGELPQVSSMLQLVDMTVSLLQSDSAQAAKKLPLLQQAMDQTLQNPHWRQDGSFSVPVTSMGKNTKLTSNLIMHAKEDGTVALTMSWLPKHDLYALTYYLSSVPLSGKTVHDSSKAEQFLHEGLGMVAESFKTPLENGESLSMSTARYEWKQMLRCNMLLQLVFVACARSEWKVARKSLRGLEKFVGQLGDLADPFLKLLMAYAKGVYQQSSGDLNAALATFQDPIFDLEQYKNKSAEIDLPRDIAILAALNTALIRYDPSSPSLSAETLQRVEPYCRNNPNRRVKAAYHIISATTSSTSSVQTKQDLHVAFNMAQETSNAQITYIAIAYMAWKYFRGVIGPQAEKNVTAACAMAKSADNKLWRSITEELLADTLESYGRHKDAIVARKRADMSLAALPPALKQANES